LFVLGGRKTIGEKGWITTLECLDLTPFIDHKRKIDYIKTKEDESKEIFELV
jgi:hypothetical protein